MLKIVHEYWINTIKMIQVLLSFYMHAACMVITCYNNTLYTVSYYGNILINHGEDDKCSC